MEDVRGGEGVGENVVIFVSVPNVINMKLFVQLKISSSLWASLRNILWAVPWSSWTFILASEKEVWARAKIVNNKLSTTNICKQHTTACILTFSIKVPL